MYHIEKHRLKQAIEDFFGSEFQPEIRKSTDQEGVFTIVQEAIPNRTEEVMSKLGELGIQLCGGAVTALFSGAAIKDLDFYVRDSGQLDRAKIFLEEWFKVSFSSSNAITYKRKSRKSSKMWTVQLITRFSGTPQDVFRNFDFTVTMGAYDFGRKEFDLHDRFLPDIAKRRLVYSGDSHFPICAMARIAKYREKGYHCPNSTVMHIALSIVQLDIQNYKQLKEQLFGIDTIYLQHLLSSKKYQDYMAQGVPVDYGEFIAEVFTAIDGPIDEAENFGDEE